MAAFFNDQMLTDLAKQLGRNFRADSPELYNFVHQYDPLNDLYIFTDKRKIPQNILDFILDGKPIQAMKEWCAASGWGLLEAKNFIEGEGKRQAYAQNAKKPQGASKPMTDDSELPKQELLIKMLGMTTSENDGQALVAIRKANKLLSEAGWDWERLINAKITVVEDPFKSVGAHDPFATMFNRGSVKPTVDSNDWAAPPPPPPRSRPAAKPWQPRPVFNPPPQQRPQPKMPNHLSFKTNIYGGGCYVCGCDVEAQAGWVFKPSDIDVRLPNKWQNACDYCNDHPPLALNAVPARRTGKPQGWQTGAKHVSAKNL